MPKNATTPIARALDTQIDEDLLRSGLDSSDRRKLRVEPLTADWCADNLGQPRHGYRIPYFDLHSGKPTAYYRVRFLQQVRRDDPKYMQPAGTPPALYFPPTLARPWREVAKDAEAPLLFVEGEKKAALACKLGIACIALGGVWSFKSTSRYWDLLPEFEHLALENRHVSVCYDTDVTDKREVHAALTEFARTLYEKHRCTVTFTFLDPVPGNPKTGLDDYLLHFGVDAFNALPKQPYDEAASIQMLNDRIAYVATSGRYYDIRRRVLMTREHARMSFGNVATASKVVNNKVVRVPAFDVWEMHPQRREVEGITYEPGNELLVTARNDLNAWQKPELRPKRGPVKQWLDHVAYIMRKGDYFDWFVKWLAYPLQYPGTKMYTATFVHGATQGVGKNLVVEPFVAHAYGDNFIRIGNSDLDSEFNSYAAFKQFGVIDELYVTSAYDRKDAMGQLKSMITREKFTLNEKYEKKRTFADCINYYITSNHADALALEESDRRIFVIESPDKAIDYGMELADWINGPGAAHILYYLLNSVDVSEFSPRAPAMRTEYREEVVSLSLTIPEVFVNELVNDPDALFGRDPFLRATDQELYSAEDLYHHMYTLYPAAPRNVTPRTIANLLQPHVRDGLVPCSLAQRHHDDRKRRVYAVFARNKWAKARGAEWHEHYFRVRPMRERT